jgi:hypothetical protein
MMRTRPALLLLSLSLCVGQNCATPAPAPQECLSTTDVTNVPAGDATGNGFSGDYLAITSTLDSCGECVQNACPGICDAAEPVVQVGAVLRVTQDGGNLMFGSGTELVTGGVNADGTFSAGIAVPSRNSEGEVNGTVLILFEGRFTSDLAVIDITFHQTANVPDLCDFQFVNAVTYQNQ